MVSGFVAAGAEGADFNSAQAARLRRTIDISAIRKISLVITVTFVQARGMAGFLEQADVENEAA